jgi:hypothetical protein
MIPIPPRVYLYGGALLAIALGIWGAYDWVWQRGADVTHAELTAVINAERAAVQGERDRSAAAARQAEQDHREAQRRAAEQYEKDKADVEAMAERDRLDLERGHLRMRSIWDAKAATCGLVSDVRSAAAESDGADRLRRESADRIVRAVGECQAQRDGLIRELGLRQAKP